MKDCAGRPIQDGDRIATTMGGYTHALELGTVIGFTEKKVRVKMDAVCYRRGETETLKFPEQLCIIY